MTEEDWDSSWLRCMGVLLSGDMPGEIDERGEHVRGTTLLILLNAYHQPVDFKLPDGLTSGRWKMEFDTSAGFAGEEAKKTEDGGVVHVTDRSLVVLSLHNG
jgi:glycogen operon protein